MRVNAYLTVTSILFGLIAIVHVLRLINGWPVSLGAWEVPMPVSWAGALFSAAFSVWAIVLLRART